MRRDNQLNELLRNVLADDFDEETSGAKLERWAVDLASEAGIKFIERDFVGQIPVLGALATFAALHVPDVLQGRFNRREFWSRLAGSGLVGLSSDWGIRVSKDLWVPRGESLDSLDWTYNIPKAVKEFIKGVRTLDAQAIPAAGREAPTVRFA